MLICGILFVLDFSISTDEKYSTHQLELKVLTQGPVEVSNLQIQLPWPIATREIKSSSCIPTIVFKLP